VSILEIEKMKYLSLIKDLNVMVNPKDLLVFDETINMYLKNIFWSY